MLEQQAALVICVNPLRRVLAISRDHDTRDWGLPGGTAEPSVDVTIADTAFRELEEETGVVADEISFLHAGRSGTHFVTTFVAESVACWPAKLRSIPFEGYVRWVNPRVLVGPTCRFRNHARTVLGQAGLL